MKSAIFAAALLVAGAAVAQTETHGTTHSGAHSGTQSTTMAGGQQVAPGNADPERDARGIPVVSDSATAPAGFNQPPAVGGSGADASMRPTPQPATENYPVCSRTVTDNCVQAYERGSHPG